MTAQTIYTDGETGEVINFPVPKEEKAELRYSRMPIELSEDRLKMLWSMGLINNDAYILFALMIERVGHDGNELESFDIQKFCTDWIGTTAKGKDKQVTPKAVMAMAQKIASVGLGSVELAVQMKLDI